MKEYLGWMRDSRTTSTYIYPSWRCGRQDPYVHGIKKEEIEKRGSIRAEENPEM